MRRSIQAVSASAILTLAVLLASAPASANPYDSSEAGHPLRIAGYILHPVGVLLDVLIFRPAHWLGSQPVIAQLIGHEGDD